MIKEMPDNALGYALQEPRKAPLPVHFSESNAQAVLQFHRQLPGYGATPLHRLRQLAHAWGVSEILVKDESTRFNLQSFKVLGSSYAIARLLCQKLNIPLEKTDFGFLVSDAARTMVGDMTFATATDGNHGRGVAWMAQKLGQKAVVFMPRATAQSRVDHIRAHGAIVEVTALNYDDTVRLAKNTAHNSGWHLIQDTAWQGYAEIPLWVMQGYMTLCSEAVEQMRAGATEPTHVFVQAGVGSLAAAVVGCLSHVYRHRPPRFIVMEPNRAACFYASAAAGDGLPRTVTGNLATIMAGLACGQPNPAAWTILKHFASAFIRCDDWVAANGVRILANPLPGDAAIAAGESGPVGIGLLDLIANHAALDRLKQELDIGTESRLLFLNTEGVTDPVNIQAIVWHGKYPQPTPIGPQ